MPARQPTKETDDSTYRANSFTKSVGAQAPFDARRAGRVPRSARGQHLLARRAFASMAPRADARRQSRHAHSGFYGGRYDAGAAGEFLPMARPSRGVRRHSVELGMSTRDDEQAECAARARL